LPALPRQIPEMRAQIIVPETTAYESNYFRKTPHLDVPMCALRSYQPAADALSRSDFGLWGAMTIDTMIGRLASLEPGVAVVKLSL
jgi:hypothetical protein